jgi:hypothetical protein
MDVETLALKLQETADRAKRNEGRIKELEEEHKILHQLATSVAVMAEQLRSMTESVDGLTGKVSALEARPGKRWESAMDKAALTAIGVLVGCVLSRMGIG